MGEYENEQNQSQQKQSHLDIHHKQHSIRDMRSGEVSSYPETARINA